MQHPVDFEERFVIDILKKINGLKPEDVIPQYHFTDFDGGNRYIDFCIKNLCTRQISQNPYPIRVLPS